MTRHERTGRIAAGLLVLANLLIPIAILTFATGFFPYKPVLPGLAGFDNLGDRRTPPEGRFDRVVFMVVDALRSDFVFMEGMGFEYTQQLIQQGSAVPFTAHATSPTITMPRIKAITTGGIPSFLDVILNFDESDTSSSLASQDTWLAQMKAKGKLLLYGDDTWLKLFPGTFDRADGTSSFFVSDFTEVDNNVTRHITHELKRDDWNTMILHYLGLDHIGHKAGPRSPNMLPKQREMDGIIREIFSSIESESHLQSTLLVLCGDHGMNDAGNHGASSAGETSPALVFMSPKFQDIAGSKTSPLGFREDFQYYATVEQSDLAPTLAALLGFPVPKNNLGAFIREFLPLWGKGEQVQILERNARQIRHIVEAAFPGLANKFETRDSSCGGKGVNQAHALACLWHDTVARAGGVEVEGDEFENWTDGVSLWLREAQSLMTSMASNYNMVRLCLGLLLTLVAIISSGISFHISRRVVEPNSSALPFTLVTAAYGAMMFASSYVEEEHHFWYWSSTFYLTYLGCRRVVSTSQDISIRNALQNCARLVLALAALRVLRGWNQTGQKWAGEPDLVKTFVLPYPNVLWALVLASYLSILKSLSINMGRLLKSVPLAVMWTLVLIPVAMTFKVAFTYEDAPELVAEGGVARKLLESSGELGLLQRAQLVFIALGFLGFFAMHSVLSERLPRARYWALAVLLDLFEVLALTQSRTTNIPLFLLLRHLHGYLEGLRLGRLEWTLLIMLLQFATFFAFGGTNAISSVDLSNAYNGVSGFNVVAVGILTYVSNWAGSMWWVWRAVMGGLERRWMREVQVEMWVAEQEERRKIMTGEEKERKEEGEVVTGTAMATQSHQPGVSASSSSSTAEPSVTSTNASTTETTAGAASTNPSSSTSPPAPTPTPTPAPSINISDIEIEPLLYTAHISLLTLFTACSLGAVMAACTLLRTHLFIWTVFSPKYLYSMAWCLGQHLLVQTVLGGGLWWVGSA